MKLLVDNKELVLDPEQIIGIEKSSPILNDDADSFSYNFTVPTENNQKVLGFPGRLQRVGNISSKNFVLEEDGAVIARGKIGFDSITRRNTVIYLKSGNTEFTKLMDGKKISDLDLGSEPWMTEYSIERMNEIRTWWNAHNRDFLVYNSEYKYTVLPLRINTTLSFIAGDNLHVNNVIITSESEQILGAPIDANAPGGGTIGLRIYCLQWSVGHLIDMIMKAAGYSVIENQILTTEWKRLLVFGKLILGRRVAYNNLFYYLNESLSYKDTVPDVDVNDFVETIKKLLCISIDFNDINKTVKIYFKKNVFTNQIKILRNETADWEHGELEELAGFLLGFGDQQDELATESEYIITETVDVVTNLPGAGADYEDQIYHVTANNRDYKCVKEGESYSWERIGRLTSYREGDGENEVNIDAIIPYFIRPEGYTDTYFELPHLEYTLSTFDKFFVDMGMLAFIFYHGSQIINGTTHYLTNADKLSVDGSVDFGRSLTPEYLYQQVYRDFISWETYRKKAVTKYLVMSLREVLALEWARRYKISDSVIILDKIKFDLPYEGIIEVEGYTA
jgi:hypothetical protein